MKLVRPAVLTAAATAFTSAVILASASQALATRDLDCADFSTQAAAQAAFESHEKDIYRLDGDDDGKACERLPDGDDRDDDAGMVPNGGVAAGGGGTADGPVNAGLVAAGAVVLVAAGGAAVTTRRLRRDH